MLGTISLVVHYYPEAFSRSATRAVAWALSQGAPLAVLVGIAAFAVGAFFTPATGKALCRRIFGGVCVVALVAFAAFCGAFIADAPIEVAELHKQIPKPPPPIIPKSYSVSDKEKLNDLCGDLIDLFGRNSVDTGNGIYAKMAALANDWNAQKRYRPVIAKLQAEWQAAIESTSVMYQAIYDAGGIYEKYSPRYPGEIKEFLADYQARLKELQESTNAAHEPVMLLEEVAKNNNPLLFKYTFSATDETIRQWWGNVSRFQAWETETAQRIEKFRDGLR